MSCFLFIVRLHLLDRTPNLSGGNLQWQVSPRSRVPLAETAGDRPLRHHPGNRESGEHQSVLYQQSLTPDAARAGDRGSDTGWHSTCWIDQGRGDEAVSDGMAAPSILMMSRTLLQSKALQQSSPATPLRFEAYGCGLAPSTRQRVPTSAWMPPATEVTAIRNWLLRSTT